MTPPPPARSLLPAAKAQGRGGERGGAGRLLVESLAKEVPSLSPWRWRYDFTGFRVSRYTLRRKAPACYPGLGGSLSGDDPLGLLGGGWSPLPPRTTLSRPRFTPASPGLPPPATPGHPRPLLPRPPLATPGLYSASGGGAALEFGDNALKQAWRGVAVWRVARNTRNGTMLLSRRRVGSGSCGNAVVAGSHPAEPLPRKRPFHLASTSRPRPGAGGVRGGRVPAARGCFCASVFVLAACTSSCSTARQTPILEAIAAGWVKRFPPEPTGGFRVDCLSGLSLSLLKLPEPFAMEISGQIANPRPPPFRCRRGLTNRTLGGWALRPGARPPE